VLGLYQVQVQGSGFRPNRFEGKDFRGQGLMEIQVEISVEIYLLSSGVGPLFIFIQAYIHVTMIRNPILLRILRKFPFFHGNFYNFP
jgi:hypothetical protein